MNTIYKLHLYWRTCLKYPFNKKVHVIKKVWRPLIYNNKIEDMGNSFTKRENDTHVSLMMSCSSKHQILK